MASFTSSSGSFMPSRSGGRGPGSVGTRHAGSGRAVMLFCTLAMLARCASRRCLSALPSIFCRARVSSATASSTLVRAASTAGESGSASGVKPAKSLAHSACGLCSEASGSPVRYP